MRLLSRLKMSRCDTASLLPLNFLAFPEPSFDFTETLTDLLHFSIYGMVCGLTRR